MNTRDQTIHAKQALLPGGWHGDVRLDVSGEALISIETGAKPQAGDVRIDLAVPGLCNLHSHAFQRAMAGLAERRGPGSDSFWSWREEMYRFALTMDPDDVEAVAAQLYVEMLEAGFTRVGEFHYLHHDKDGAPYANLAEMAERIASASRASGIAMTLLPVLYARGGFGGQTANDGQRRFLNSPERFQKLWQASTEVIARLPGGEIGVAPHSLRSVKPDELRLAIEIAGERPIHIHIAEQVREVEDCIAWSGRRPVEWLLANASVDERWCLIHATHMTHAETLGVAASGAVAGLCPLTEANLGDGVFNAEPFVAAGGRIGIGSDSNIEISAASELKMLEYSQRLSLRRRNVMASAAGQSTGRSLFDAALSGGHQALGSGPAGLRVGGVADIVALGRSSSALSALSPDRVLDAWIFAPGAVSVDRVWARGALLVENGRHHARDAIAARFDRTMERLLG
ncbi:MAG: formimidoylglutamate deiminase [Beijerinckiaceae bacterium]|nr:formimidoylglutamate deiminase [Beijerinckiaceae bacterium]